MTMHAKRTRPLAALALALLLAGGAFGIATAQNQPKEALTADEAMACIRTALTAHAGFIREVEADDEDGKRICEVKIVDAAGKRHQLHIDVLTNQVVKTK